MLGRVSKNVEDCGAWREELKLPAAGLPGASPPSRFHRPFYQNALLFVWWTPITWIRKVLCRMGK